MCLAVVGQKLAAEAKKTVDFCVTVSQESPKVFSVYVDKEAQKNFLIFAQQVHQKTTKIEAAGFFPIDNSLIVFAFSNICTYIIVACQMLPSSKSSSLA